MTNDPHKEARDRFARDQRQKAATDANKRLFDQQQAGFRNWTQKLWHDRFIANRGGSQSAPTGSGRGLLFGCLAIVAAIAFGVWQLVS